LTGRKAAVAGIVLVSSSALKAIVPTCAAGYARLAVVTWLLGCKLARNIRRYPPLELLAIVYTLTVVIGIWAAYDTASALMKAAQLLIAVLLMVAVVSLPSGHTKDLALAMGLLGGVLALGFVLLSDPLDSSVDFEFIRRARMWFSLGKGSSKPFILDSNVVAGLLLCTLPILLSVVIQSISQSRIQHVILYAPLAVIQLFGLVLTSSRGAWLALVTAPVAGLALFSGCRVWRTGGMARVLLMLAVFVVAGVLSVFLVRQAPLVGEFVQRVPGAPTLGERVGLYKDTLDLISDFPYTGGGLAAFSGLYSANIRVIPFHYLRYSHNLYFDIALEQGVLGLLAALGIFAYALLFSVREIAKRAGGRPYDCLAIGSCIGLIAVLIHGLGDDPLYGISGTPFLFIPAALAIYFSSAGKQPTSSEQTDHSLHATEELSRRSLRRTTIIVLLLTVAGGARILASGMVANIAAVRLATIELNDWTGEGWPDAGSIEYGDGLLATLTTAVRIEVNQVTALHRLGHIALATMDFDSAVSYLDRAHASNPTHRGISKELGYALLWRGEVDRAIAYLRGFREASEELSAYAWWWQTQGEDDLVMLARQASQALSDINTRGS